MERMKNYTGVEQEDCGKTDCECHEDIQPGQVVQTHRKTGKTVCFDCYMDLG